MPDRSSPQPEQANSPVPGASTHSKIVDLATLLLLIPVLLPLVAVFSPSLYFESDPRTTGEYSSAISFGPTGMAYLVVASVAIAAFALFVTAWEGKRIRVWSFGLVAAGIIPCLIQMPTHFTNRLHCGAWIAAACLGLAAAHLAQFPRAKRLILTALVAMALPLFIQGAWYVYVEHPETVRAFMENEQQSIEARGLTFGSSQHAKYLTRLQGNDVIGALGMSNVLGSILAGITMLSLCCFKLGWWRKCAWWHIATTLLITGLAAWALMLTQSKGAMLALFATAGFALGVSVLFRFRLPVRRAIPGLCVAFVLLGSIAVLLRGAAGPPDDHTGERSLLFRYHYWQGAADILISEPAAVLLGVGPGKFKDHYETVRNPISPEVVSSTHNVFVDYIAMLGLGGLAWCVLLIGWVWQAGRSIAAAPPEVDTSGRAPPTDRPIKQFALLAAVVFGLQYYVQFPGLYAETAILWLVGMLGFVFLASYVVYPVWSASRSWVNLAAALVACLWMLHAQIEMTFFWPSAVGLMWVVTAAASVGQAQSTDMASARRAWPGFIPAGSLAVLAIVLLFMHAEPMARHQAHLAKAASVLRLSGPPAAIQELDQAASVIANDPATTRWRIRLREEVAVALNANGQPGLASDVLDQALMISDQAEQAGLDGLSAARRRGTLTLGAYYITNNPVWLGLAKEAYTQAVTLSPHSLSDHVRLADIHWDLSEFDAAQTTYQRALKISDQFYLDPDVQLPDEERKRIEGRLADNSADVTP